VRESEMKEYIGNKVDIVCQNDGRVRIKITEHVLNQKLQDEFISPDGKTSKTPAVPGQVLVKGDGSHALSPQDATMYCSGTALCIYKLQCPDLTFATLLRTVPGTYLHVENFS
jgi:hypothetical protein